MEYEPVIGLEVHVKLKTRTKLFSSAPNQFGAEPNTNIGLTDTAQPGTLPILNREAVNKALLFALAIGADIAHVSQFDRKSYFYPDSPRNFQITQFYKPIMHRGQIVTRVGDETKTFPVEHAHIEDDAGMLKHCSSFAGVDYNRAGVPLLEIVSEPCMHSAEDAVAYASAIKAIMEYIGASDTNMEEGSMRFDVNVSLRPKGSSELWPKAEIKNMNSFTNMKLAIAAEIRRQLAIYEEGGTVAGETFRFDLETNQVVKMRSKEDAADYRYFPEPDLPPLVVTEEQIDALRKNLPELPRNRYDRYVNELKISEYNAQLLVNDKTLSDYFEGALALCNNPIALCNWITVEFVGRFKDLGTSLPSSGIPPKHIAALVNMIDDKTINGKIAKKVADIMIEHPAKHPTNIVDENPGFKPMTDTGAIGAIIDDVLAKNAQSVTDYKNGMGRAFNFLIGQVMKETKGSADPATVNKLLKEKLEK